MSRTSLISCIFVIGLAGAGLMIYFRGNDEAGLQHVLGPEAFGHLFNFWVLVVLGGAISFAHQQFVQAKEEAERTKRADRERREEEKRAARTTYDELLSAYNTTKRVRRLLRARVLRAVDERAPADAHVIFAQEYDVQMESLIDAHLEFESIERRVRGNQELFDDDERYCELQRALNSIHQYLHDTLEEYEDLRTEFAGDPPQRRLVDLPVLMEFIGPVGVGAEYWQEFKQPFKSALRCLRLEILRRSEMGAHDTDKAPSPSSKSAAKSVASLVLGQENGGVRLVRHRPEWPALFAQEAGRLRETFADVESIEHIGNTGVPGLSAEPVLGLLVAVSSLAAGREMIPVLAELGYERDLELESPERLVFCHLQEERCTHQVTLAEKESDYYQDQLRFRDLLLADAGARRRYESRKHALVRANPGDRAAYLAANDLLVAEILSNARES